ncbi:MAG: hypothetical protein SGJ24_02715 [Chloroflexota bacterium]|nr:hypothetical protein [Chloroflexota bacterium]
MAVQLTIPFETLVELVKQLPPDQRSTLIERVLHKDQPKRLSEQLLVFKVGAWPEGMTLRREDEYGDDGR